jgi:putative addiction module component (TIGR02574 family)
MGDLIAANSSTILTHLNCSEAEREGEVELTPEQAAELDRRCMDHVQRPEPAIPWDDVRRRLMKRSRRASARGAILNESV